MRYKVVNITELGKAETLFNNDRNGSLTSATLNGQPQVCPLGCSDCNCSSCLSYFTENIYGPTQSCKRCAPDCKFCI